MTNFNYTVQDVPPIADGSVVSRKPLTLLVGDNGVGKTRLLHAMRDDLGDAVILHGHRVPVVSEWRTDLMYDVPLNSNASNLHETIAGLETDGLLEVFNDFLNDHDFCPNFHNEFRLAVEDKNDKSCIMVYSDRGDPVNLASMNRGMISLVTSVLFIWQNMNFNRVILLENPEVFMHPTYQGILSRVLCHAVKEGTSTFIVETLSEAMINEVGCWIRDDKFNLDDASIAVLFDKGPHTEVTMASYNDNGTLNNWRYGLFNRR